MPEFIGFKLLIGLPIVRELATTIQFCASDTSLNYLEWIRLEDIRGDLLEAKYGAERSILHKPVGKKIGKIVSIVIGLVAFLMVVVILMAPMLIFSELNPSKIIDHVTRAEINIELMIPGKVKVNVLKNIPLQSTKPQAKVILKMAKSQHPPIDVLSFLNNASHEVWVTPKNAKDLTSLSKNAKPTLKFQLKVWTEQRKSESLSYPQDQFLDDGTVYSWRKLSERACTKKGLLGQVYLGSLFPTLEINNNKLTLTNNSYLHRFPIILQYSCSDDLKKYIGVAKFNSENYIVVTSSTFETSTTLLKKMNIGTTIIAIYVAIITLGGMTFIRPALLNKAQYCWIKKSPDAQV